MKNYKSIYCSTIIFLIVLSVGLVSAYPIINLNHNTNTSLEYLNIAMSATSVNETYIIPDINQSIIAIYSFENGSRQLNSYGDSANFTTSVNLCGTYKSRHGSGIKINNSFFTKPTGNLNSDGFAISFYLHFNDTRDSAITNQVFLDFYNSSAGKKGFQGYLSNYVDSPDFYGVLHNFTQIVFYIYNGTNYSTTTVGFRIYDVDMSTPQRILLNLNLKEGYAETWVNGELHYTDSTVPPYGYFVPSNIIAFKKNTDKHIRYLDEVIIHNRSLNSLESRTTTFTRPDWRDDAYMEVRLFSNISDEVNLDFYKYGTYLFNMVAIAHGNNGANITTQINYTNLKSLVPIVAKKYPNVNSLNVGERVKFYLRSDYIGYFDNYQDTAITNKIQVSNDSLTWTNLTTTWLTPQKYAVLGDSNNVYADQSVGGIRTWIVHFMNMTTIEENKVQQYALGGSNCTYSYQRLVQNVTNDTDVLFISCGVNKLMTTNNTYEWERIYNEAKAKGIANIYMTTLAPWDSINLNLTGGEVMCNKVKSDNAWLLNFDETHDDLFLYDIWTDTHDTSGTNLTDCGWRNDIIYDRDGIHFNTAGFRMWALNYWDAFNQTVYNTSTYIFTAPDLEETTTFTFRGISNMSTQTTNYIDLGDITIDVQIPLTISEHAEDTNTIVFTAFGLIAVMIIASAGYIFFQILKGDMDISTVGILAITAVMVAVVLIVGFYILSIIANSIV